MDTISRRVDALATFFAQQVTSVDEMLAVADLLLRSVASVCDPGTTAQVAKRFAALISAALPHDPPPKI